MNRIDVPVPPRLLALVGYPGDARFVALYFGLGDEAYYADGQVSGTGDPHAYLAYVRHVACMDLAGYDLGSSDDEARHWLVLDTREGAAYIASAPEANRFLREQWLESPAILCAPLTQEQWDELSERVRAQLEAQPVPTMADVMQRLKEHQAGIRQMVAWLDATPQAEHGRQRLRRMVEGGE